MSLNGPYEEKLLLREVSEGNEKAFRVLYDRYVGRLSAYIFKICKSEIVTEEIVQDIFTKLWISRSSLEDIAVLEAYLFSMARNKTIDYLRRVARETGLISLLTRQFYVRPGGDNSNNIEEQLNASELRQLIASALAQLSDQKKTIFRLSKIEGRSHDEIAATMDLSKSTVKNHLSETLQYLRGKIGGHTDSEPLLLLTLIFLMKK